MLIIDEQRNFLCPHARKRCGRRAGRPAARLCRLPVNLRIRRKDVFKKEANASPASQKVCHAMHVKLAPAKRRFPSRVAVWPARLPFERQARRISLAAPAKSKIEPASQAQSCALPTWWFWRGGCTRSHSEHGRETPQRRWYFVSRRGRVGRCQVCKTQEKQKHLLKHAAAKSQKTPQATNNAGWSSPVARQAHNLKAAGSNPAPATTETCNSLHSRRFSASSSARNQVGQPSSWVAAYRRLADVFVQTRLTVDPECTHASPTGAPLVDRPIVATWCGAPISSRRIRIPSEQDRGA